MLLHFFLGVAVERELLLKYRSWNFHSCEPDVGAL